MARTCSRPRRGSNATARSGAIVAHAWTFLDCVGIIALWSVFVIGAFVVFCIQEGVL